MNKHEKNIACCFTGHRKIPQKKYIQIQEKLKDKIVKAIQNGYTFFYAGGAVGFDTMAAQAVLELKAQHPHIKLILVLPCVNQTDGWEQSDIDEYEPTYQKNIKKAVCTKEIVILSITAVCVFVI